jgi:23S rRNA U2552 (ribose-2'-O)-methylase RlmE/FtsJ
MLVIDAIAAPGGWRDQAARRRAPLRDGGCDA